MYAASALKQDNDSTPFEIADQVGRAPRTQSANELTPATINKWWWTYIVLAKVCMHAFFTSLSY